ncbi:MAG: type II/IV secretion system protein [Candidatus Doudnabacteria bacterium]|nr:type II/IV secretion system protein [Candidatus Doudnabacteria bacterium]
MEPARRLNNLRLSSSELTGGKTGKVTQAVADLDRRFEEREVAAYAKKLGLPYFNLYAFPVDQAALGVLTFEQAAKAEVVPFYRDKNNLKLGMVNHNNPNLNEVLSYLEKGHYTVDVYLVSHSGYANALKGYESIKIKTDSAEKLVVSDNVPAAVVDLKTLAASGPDILQVSATEFLSKLLTAAVSLEASDIHAQPEKEQFSIRFRIDGVLQEIARFHITGYHGFISRIKILAKMKLNVTKVPQDGSFVINASGHQFEIRVSVLPATYGEAVVLRLLGEQVALEIKSLGLRDLAYQRVADVIARPHGLILTTGPTGSGKTTSLYAFLKEENQPGVKIITLENPVEYRLSGVEQIQIDESLGLTFANALKSTLRQDPDVIMVGEIRDFDTAETAAQAALTGHMVYSTLHTNDAAGAIPRLLNLGVRPVILAPALSAVIAQRLVRKICQNCKTEEKLSPSMYARVRAILNSISPAAGVTVPKDLKFFHSPGCAVCHYIGYKGRIGVFEVFLVDDAMQKLIFAESSTVEIKAQAARSGMISMIQDGLLKALEGTTDVAEVLRVTEE